MKTTLTKLSSVALFAPAVAGMAFLLGCASESPRYASHPHGYPNHPADYPQSYPQSPVLYPSEPPNPPPPQPGPAPGAYRRGWTLIGSTVADYEADHDAILLPGPYDDFSQIRFKVTGAPLNLDHLVVTYDNGQPDEIRVRQKIGRGGESRIIDLRGGRRSLRRIDFWYDTRGYPRQRAEVTVYGR